MATAADDRLRLLIERVERLEEEKKGIADDIRDVYAEAKAVGYDAKIMRQIVRLRKMKPDDRAEMEAISTPTKRRSGWVEWCRRSARRRMPMRRPARRSTRHSSPTTGSASSSIRPTRRGNGRAHR